MRRTIGMTIAAIGLAAGCGASPSVEATDRGESAGAERPGDAARADRTPSPPEPWETMSREAKGQWMREEVMPRMTELFRDFDAERYESVTCATCHGPGATQGQFAMPSVSLPALPPTGTPEQRAMVSQHGPMVRFMFQRVLPTMQTLVGGRDYDEESGEGFSCFSCHPHPGAEGATLIELRVETTEGS